MTLNQVKEILPLFLTLVLILLERMSKIKKANDQEREMYKDVISSYKDQVAFLQDELEKCTDSTRPKRPGD